MTAFEIWVKLGEAQLQLDRTQLRINTIKHKMSVNNSLSSKQRSQLNRLHEAMQRTEEIRE